MLKKIRIQIILLLIPIFIFSVFFSKVANAIVLSSSFDYTLTNGGNKTVMAGNSVTNTVTASFNTVSRPNLHPILNITSLIDASGVSMSPSSLGIDVLVPSAPVSANGNINIITSPSTPAGTYTITLSAQPPLITASCTEEAPADSWNYIHPITCLDSIGNELSTTIGSASWYLPSNASSFNPANSLCNSTGYSVISAITGNVNISCNTYRPSSSKTTSFTLTVTSQLSSSYIDIGFHVKDPSAIQNIAIINPNFVPPAISVSGSCDIYNDDIGTVGGFGASIGTKYIECTDGEILYMGYVGTQSYINIYNMFDQLFDAYLIRKCGSLANATKVGHTFSCNTNMAIKESSPLRMVKNGITYSVALVSPTDPDATKALIKLGNGVIMALRKFTDFSYYFADQGAQATGSCSSSQTTFSSTFNINNPYNSVATLNRTTFNPISLETAPGSFTLPSNTTVSKGGFGNLVFSGCLPVPPAQYGGTGSATYSVTINGVIVGSVKYSWTYAL